MNIIQEIHLLNEYSLNTSVNEIAFQNDVARFSLQSTLELSK